VEANVTLRRKIKIAIGTIAVLLVVVAIVGFRLYRDRLTVSLPDYPPVKKAVWLDQGWKQDQREWFHHGDQGTQTLNIPYEWFVALEQPRISLVGPVGRLSDPAYLDRYGFIPGETAGGENPLPIGFARGKTMRTVTGEPWRNPQTKEEMIGIGFTCAACHTGRLVYQKTAILIDGGPALTDLGKFRQGLGISVLFTRLVPGRFARFANNVLGEEASDEAKAALRKQLDAVWAQFNVVRKLDKKVADGSVEEGFGRLDALNRIGNQVFALDLAKPESYAATTAPVNFPHIWSTPWFDWVQYNGSIEQPMVRNAGEALGVAAMINLTDPRRALFESGVNFEELFKMERLLAGSPQPKEKHEFNGLRSPKWPDILGPIDSALATRGAALYDNLCKGCHLAPVGSREFWDSNHWLPPNEHGQRYLRVNLVNIAGVGTDSAHAEDMANRKVVVPPDLGIKSNEFGPALGELVEKTVNHWYDRQDPPITGAKRAEMNGYRKNGIQAPLKYKARPLNGVWATPPFLHNGSVPNVYALLSPAAERPKVFYLGRREFDPVCLGYQLVAKVPPESQLDLRCLGDKTASVIGEFDGGFKMDTAIRGNRNIGHEFNDGRAAGVIGRKLAPDERRAIIEYLKTL
jgi:RoxA-like, cytochrome c-like